MRRLRAGVLAHVILFAGLAAGQQLPATAPQPLVHRLPALVDPALQAPDVEIGRSLVVPSSLGRYREAGVNRNDRMAYLFEASAAGRLIRLTLTSPDDKPRMGEVFTIAHTAAPLEALGSGFFCGYPFPVTGKMIRQSFYFHAPDRHFAVVLMTSKQGAPAAIASLQLDELDGRQEIPAWPVEMKAAHRRSLGIYWEDPVLSYDFAGDPRKLTDDGAFEVVLDRQIDYLKRVGHSSVIYPLVWYRGALYQPSEEYPDQKQVNRPHPPEFDKSMARRYSQEGIAFWPSIRNWRLASLQAWVKTPEEVRSGAVTDYVNTVTAAGQVKTQSQWHAPPYLNAFHPRVQTALKNLVADMMNRIGSEPSVQGVALFTTIHSTHGLGTIDQSYDDYSLKQFSKDTGIRLPALDGPVEDRFRQWHDWLQKQHWEAWIRWRKGKETQLLNDLAHIVASKKPGAKLQVMVKYPIPTMNAGLKVSDVGKYLDEIGLDIEELARNRDILISRIYRSGAYQIQLRDHDERSAGMEELLARSRLDFDAGWQGPFVGRTAGAVIQYDYFEAAWKNPERLRLPTDWGGGEPAWHVTSPKGAGQYALEYVAQSLALYDAQFIMHGGY